MKIKKIPNTKYQIPNTIMTDHSGITLLELMVSVALFALTIVLATGIFQSVINSQRTAVASEDLQENIRYDFERMSKEIRTAQKDATHSCITSGNIYYSPSATELEFINYRGQCVDYKLQGGQIYISYPNSSDPVLVAGLPLTPTELKISKMVFKITDSALKVQAIVNVRMRLSINVKASPAEVMDMGTSLSSRNYQ